MGKKGNAGVITGIIVTMTGLLAMALPWLANADMMAWGYGTMVLGFFVLTAGVTTLLLYRRRQKVLRRMADGREVLARWTYDPKDWERWRRHELKENRAMPVFGAILGGIFVVIGLVFFLTDPDDMGLMLALMAGIGLLIAGVALLSAVLRNRAISRDPGEVIIARGGIWFMGALTDWNNVTSWMDRAEVQQKGKHHLFVVQYRALAGRAGHIHKSILEIPIPKGREEEALAAARKLNDNPY